jgi:glycosyltransferase involved in cell wall biosynthesis
MTILQVITPRHYSGAERVVVHLSEALAARGHRVVVATKPNADLERELRARDVEVHPLRIAGKLNLLAPGRIARLARQIGADLIHTHLSSGSLWGGLAGRRAGIPVLSHVHAINSPFSYRHADRLVTCSEGVRQHLISRGFPGSKIDVLYYGLSPKRFTGLRGPAEVRKELGLSPAAPVLGIVAHLHRKKGQAYVIQTLPQLRRRFPGLVLLLVGKGGQRGLQELARRLGVEQAVRFLGYRPDAIELMQAMDIVLLPSVAKEGFGIVLVEAGYLGKPVIGSDFTGINEVIVDGVTGLLAPIRDSVALGDRIEALLADPERARQYGAAGRERAEQLFTDDKMGERMEEIYLRLLGSGR